MAEPDDDAKSLAKRKRDPSLALDVDLLTLDYVVYKAIEDALGWYEKGHSLHNEDSSEDARILKGKLNNHRWLVNQSIERFLLDHPSHKLSLKLSMRLELFRVLMMLIQREDEKANIPPQDLTDLCKRNHERAAAWRLAGQAKPSTQFHHGRSTSPRSYSSLESSARSHFPSSTKPTTDSTQSRTPILGLYNILPALIGLVSMCYNLCVSRERSVATERLLELFGLTMAQAVIERATSDSAFPTREMTILDAFAWGPYDDETTPDPTDSLISMFFLKPGDKNSDSRANESGRDAAPWCRIREEFFNLTVSYLSSQSDKEREFVELQMMQGRDESFDEQLCELLIALNASVERPTLQILDDLLARNPGKMRDTISIEGMELTWAEIRPLLKLWDRSLWSRRRFEKYEMGNGNEDPEGIFGDDWLAEGKIEPISREKPGEDPKRAGLLWLKTDKRNGTRMQQVDEDGDVRMGRT